VGRAGRALVVRQHARAEEAVAQRRAGEPLDARRDVLEEERTQLEEVAVGIDDRVVDARPHRRRFGPAHGTPEAARPVIAASRPVAASWPGPPSLSTRV